MTETANAGIVTSFAVDLSGTVATGLSITTIVTYRRRPAGLTPGDSSAFSKAVQAVAVVIQFVSATTTPEATPQTIDIPVTWTDNSSGMSPVADATADGTAVAGVDYVANSGTLAFGPGISIQQIPVTLLDARVAVGDFTFTITLSSPAGGATLGSPSTTTVIISENNQTNTYIVNTTSGGTIQDGPSAARSPGQSASPTRTRAPASPDPI